MQVLKFNNLKWENRPPAEAVFVCIECGCEIEHEHKSAMVDAGEWRPGPHPQFPDDPPPDQHPIRRVLTGGRLGTSPPRLIPCCRGNSSGPRQVGSGE